MKGIKIYCQQTEPGLLHVADITPADQEDYPAPEAIVYWRLTLYRDTKPVLVTSTADARSKEWLIDSRDFGLAEFSSDIYSVLIELVGHAIGARTLANYFVTVPAATGSRIWITKNGAYYDFTDEGVFSDGNWTWKVLSTYDVYEHVQVRNSVGQIALTDAVVDDVIQATTYDNSSAEVVLISGLETRVFCRADRLVWAGLILAQVRLWLAGPPTSLESKSVEPDTKLAQIGQKLELLESGLILDEGLARKLLQLIKTALSAWRQ